MQRTMYSVSASVNSTGAEDLNSGPRSAKWGIADSCSAYLGRDEEVEDEKEGQGVL